MPVIQSPVEFQNVCEGAKPPSFPNYAHAIVLVPGLVREKNRFGLRPAAVLSWNGVR